MRRFLLITFLFLVAAQYAAGQISQGGHPMDLPGLKSSRIPERIMPSVDNIFLQQQETNRQLQEPGLKPLRFAHGFNVNISPETDGAWVYGINGYDVWRMKIRSEGAFSLNLIFDAFHLPQGARLFIFNDEAGHYLGAFTSRNNKSSGKFAISPVAGDELIVQYEVPSGKNPPYDFVITQVNHDYIGILKYSDRRPLGKTAGSCNIDINCGSEWADEKDAVCRIITTKKNRFGKTYSEICSGTLVNNTAENQKPYIITAAHCIEKGDYAETSVFAFNYESPFCAPLDGDPGNTISGSRLLAISDSLDFALVELSLVPPPEFRPYFAGWDRSGSLPDSSVSIHHPQGDIKKIAFDSHSPVYSDFITGYTPNGFLKILRWENGVTENGSSGGSLFNSAKNLVGTLTGGEATCSNPVNDYYSRFELAWEYRPDSGRQLKYWLDPLNSDSGKLNGKRFYSNENLCLAYTNLTVDDTTENIILRNQDQFAGYWGGTNSEGITEFSERFFLQGDVALLGISLGVGKIKLTSSASDREIKINIYDGGEFPGTLIHSEPVIIESLFADAMNFVGFSETVEPADSFFVGFELYNLQPQDTFVVYQSLRQPEKENHFWFRKDGLWHDFKASNTENSSIVNVFELVACNVQELVNDTPIVANPKEAVVYPNPAYSAFTFEAGQGIVPENIRVFNLIGQEVQAKLLNHNEKKIQIDLSGNIPGIYFVRLKTDSGIIAKKVTYLPW